MKYRDAQDTDLMNMEQLLKNYNLPANDCDKFLANFVIVEVNNEIIALGGFEDYEKEGLLRSFVVRDDYRNQGIAKKIFNKLKDKASKKNIKKFYLLTTTASEYFARLGFVHSQREDAPDLIKKTKQFSTLCPSQSDFMVLCNDKIST